MEEEKKLIQVLLSKYQHFLKSFYLKNNNLFDNWNYVLSSFLNHAISFQKNYHPHLYSHLNSNFPATSSPQSI